MNPSPTIITRETFIKRLSTLCLRSGCSDFPKDEENRHILLKSALLQMEKDRVYTEKEINAKLADWVETSKMESMDHITMRRYLVDAGYLTRTSNGTSYQLSSPVLPSPTFEESIDSLNLAEILEEARADIQRRKELYMNQPKKK